MGKTKQSSNTVVKKASSTFAKTSKPSKSGNKKVKTTSKEELLGVIAHIASLHHGKAPLDLVARRSGYGKADNPSIKKALQRAAAKGLLIVHNKGGDDTIELTDDGREQAGDASDFFLTNATAQAKIKQDLSPNMKVVFDFLVNQLGNGVRVVSRQVIADMLDYPSGPKDGGFQKLLCRMKLAQAIDFVGKDDIQLSDAANPEGCNGKEA